MADLMKPPKAFKEQQLNKSKGMFDDHAVRKSVLTREGTITHTPANDNDIVNKKYVDDEISGVGTPKLNEVENPDASKVFNLGNNKTLSFTSVDHTPVADEGIINMEAKGAFSGSLLHIHQHTGNPGATELVTIEAEDADVIPLDINGAHATGIDLNSSKIVNLVDPTADQEAATKKYVDDEIGGVDSSMWETKDATTNWFKVAKHIDMDNRAIFGVIAPTSPQGVATKQYVDDNIGVSDGITLIGQPSAQWASVAMAADTDLSSRFRCHTSGTINRIGIPVYAQTNGNKLKIGIYSDDGGIPGTKLGECAEHTFVAADVYATRLILDLDSGVDLTENTFYWFVWNVDTNAYTWMTYTAATSLIWGVYKARAYDGTLPANYPAAGLSPWHMLAFWGMT